MAKDHGSILNYVLIGGAAYLAWQWYQAQSAPGVAQPVTGTPATPSAGTNTSPVSHAVPFGPCPSTYTGGGSSNPNCTTAQVCAFPDLPSDVKNLLAQSGKCNPSQGGTPAPVTVAPAAGTVNGVPYTGTKASYYLAVMKALGNVSGNSQSQTIDEWNYYMDHIGFTGFSSGGGDPDQIMSVTGTHSGEAISPATYVDAIQKLGLLPYPSGLTGLAALAAGINRINRHPLAQGAPGNQFYPKPRKVVM